MLRYYFVFKGPINEQEKAHEKGKHLLYKNTINT